MKKYGYLLIIGLVVVAGIFVINAPPQEDKTALDPKQSSDTETTFARPKKSAHYESNTPAHESILAAPPINIVIDFNFDLTSNSSISIVDTNDIEYGSGDTSVDRNKLALRRSMSHDSPDGVYTVNYNACWPDASCHDGSFQFAINRSLGEDYLDLRNRSAVEIKLSDIAFKPARVKVSAGTRITWLNDEEVTHYVNTDAHPSHTYYPAQNSNALAKGEEFSLVFDKAGIYPYHCSAHASDMIGSIIVE